MWNVTTTGPGAYIALYSPDASGRLKLDTLTFNSGFGATAASPQQQIAVSDPVRINAILTAIGRPVWDPATESERELEYFLLMLYASGVSLTSASGQQFNLHADMASAGVLSHYSRIRVDDFARLTGVIVLDGQFLAPGSNRLDLTKVQKNGVEGLNETIRHLGIWGLIDYLYVGLVLNESQYGALLREWKPSLSAREQHIYQVLTPFSRQRNFKLLSIEDVAEILNA